MFPFQVFAKFPFCRHLIALFCFYNWIIPLVEDMFLIAYSAQNTKTCLYYFTTYMAQCSIGENCIRENVTMLQFEIYNNIIHIYGSFGPLSKFFI